MGGEARRRLPEVAQELADTQRRCAEQTGTIAALEHELAQVRAKNRELHRRCQAAEATAYRMFTRRLFDQAYAFGRILSEGAERDFARSRRDAERWKEVAQVLGASLEVRARYYDFDLSASETKTCDQARTGTLDPEPGDDSAE